jgi:hypothetical protein
MNYSLWKIEHLDSSNVIAWKVKDTNSGKEADRWMEDSWMNVASHYRKEEEINAEYLQTFNND